MAERLDEPYGGYMDQICEELGKEGAVSFQETFCRKMEECLRGLPLKKDEREVFLHPFRIRGFQDGEMQLKNLEQGARRLSDVIRLQEKERREKCRMAVGLGAMSGLLLLIILL